jgi:hypothetical protein
MRNKRGAIEFSFSWIFAILVGAFILFLAIYGVIKFVDIQKTSKGAEGSMSIGVLTNPLETSFESVKRGMIITPSETRIWTNCSNASRDSPIFGKQIIATSEKSYNQWGQESVNVNFKNKYIYSKNPVEGKKFYVFSKPFEFPFKISDLIYLTSVTDKYCFINPPSEIEDELNDLRGQVVSENENLFIEDVIGKCPSESIFICFNGETNCDVSVHRGVGVVQRKNEKPVYFQGDALMYAAIFSDRQDYECQLDRLMNRTEQLFEIYSDKSRLILQKSGCNSELDVELVQMLALIKGFQDSADLSVIYILAEDMNNKNEYAECKLW